MILDRKIREKIPQQLPPEQKQELKINKESSEENDLGQLKSFYHEIKGCVKCSLGTTRTNFVFGVGNSNADLILVGEAPGRDEDLQGIPFVGRAGQLLTLMNIEGRIPLFWLFIAEIFVDAGNVWAEVSDFDPAEIRFTTGLGLAIITPLGPVRLDYGYKLNKRSIDKDNDSFHLGIYFAF